MKSRVAVIRTIIVSDLAFDDVAFGVRLDWIRDAEMQNKTQGSKYNIKSSSSKHHTKGCWDVNGFFCMIAPLTDCLYIDRIEYGKV